MEWYFDTSRTRLDESSAIAHFYVIIQMRDMVITNYQLFLYIKKTLFKSKRKLGGNVFEHLLHIAYIFNFRKL